jgi:hypothetical protein
MAQARPNVVKPLFLDVGLAGRLLGSDRRALGRTEADRLINEGPLAEQFVGQHLVFQGPGGEGDGRRPSTGCAKGAATTPRWISS